MDNFQEEEAVTKQYDSKLMRRMLSFAKPFWKSFLIIMLLMIVTTSLGLLQPTLMKIAIDDNINGYKRPFALSSPSVENSVKIGDEYFIHIAKDSSIPHEPYYMIYSGKNAFMVKGNIDANKEFTLKEGSFVQANKNYPIHAKLTESEVKALRGDDIHGLFLMAGLLLLILVSNFFFNYGQIYLLQITGQKIILNIRADLFKHIESLSLSFFDKTPIGKLVTRVTNDTQTLNEMYTGVLIYLIRDIFMLTGILIFMFVLDFKLALITLCVTPIIFLSAFLFKKYDRAAYRKVRAKLSKINSFLSENISGMKVVQCYSKEDKKFKEFDVINTDYKNASLEQIVVFGIFRPSIDLLYSLALALVLWFGGIRVFHNEISLGVLFAFISYLGQFFNPIFDLTEKYDILQSAMAASERIFLLMDTDATIKNPTTPVNVNRLEGNIEFKNVWFAYNNDDWVLKDVSFKIQKGEKIAFVGATGAGKTSIISLISRLYDIQKGEILIDGINIKDMRKEDLRRNMATVLQDVFLFTGDITSNVRLNNADISNEEVIKACKYVNADKFIEKLPDKYNSKVNERGSTFSQGERQLIAFARAIAFNPPILVLDEATSNIDTETESLIQDALDKITRDRTTIVVAHRLSTIRNSDKIIVLHKGRIREIGSHEELLKKEGLYYNLYKLQYAGIELSNK